MRPEPKKRALARTLSRPAWGTWRRDSPEYSGDKSEQPFLTAHQVESVDPRLVGYGIDGTLRGVRYMEMSAILVAAVQELQTEVTALKEQRCTLAKLKESLR